MTTDYPPCPVSVGDSTPYLKATQTQVKDVTTMCKHGDTLTRTQLKTPQKQWQLQSSVLALHSIWFKQSVEQQKTASNGAIEEYTFVIMEVDGQARLGAQDRSLNVSTASRVGEDARIKVEDVVEAAAHEAIDNVYDQIFKTFDGLAPSIANNNIKTATIGAEQLAKVAQDLGCVHLISVHIGNALFQYSQTHYKAFLADPPRYLLLPIALENDFIYTESLIHMIGAYPCWPWSTGRATFPTHTMELITRKSQELDHEVLLTERELLLTILNSRGVPFSFEVPSQFDTWFAIQLFRDTISSVLRSNDDNKPSLRRGSLMRKIKQGGNA
ncbi:hypothetical protein E8E11_008340 [Didymella keratinophila]|nr:hypothetical protein E8E11_008340 [Didymella keratinophila]